MTVQSDRPVEYKEPEALDAVQWAIRRRDDALALAMAFDPGDAGGEALMIHGVDLMLGLMWLRGWRHEGQAFRLERAAERSDRWDHPLGPRAFVVESDLVACGRDRPRPRRHRPHREPRHRRLVDGARDVPRRPLPPGPDGRVRPRRTRAREHRPRGAPRRDTSARRERPRPDGGLARAGEERDARPRPRPPRGQRGPPLGPARPGLRVRERERRPRRSTGCSSHFGTPPRTRSPRPPARCCG